MLRIIVLLIASSGPNPDFFPGYNIEPCPKPEQDMIMVLPKLKAASQDKDPILTA